MMISCIKNAIVNGASIRGKMHKENHLPNQDCYEIKRTSYGFSLCVCDGVGSHKYSKQGAKAASKAVYKVFKLYYKKKIEKDEIGEKIRFYYNKNLRNKYRKEAGTTCLFAFIYKTDEIIIGQAGDGLILIKVDHRFATFQTKKDDFINEVCTLNGNHPFNSWKIRTLNFDSQQHSTLSILLTTDGLSEDIIPEKRESLLDHFMELSKKRKDHRLLKELKKWNVPGSFDDKTIIVFRWRK